MRVGSLRAVGVRSRSRHDEWSNTVPRTEVTVNDICDHVDTAVSMEPAMLIAARVDGAPPIDESFGTSPDSRRIPLPTSNWRGWHTVAGRSNLSPTERQRLEEFMGM